MSTKKSPVKAKPFVPESEKVTSTGKSFAQSGDRLQIPSKLIEGKVYEVSTADVAQHMFVELGKTLPLADGSLFVDPSTIKTQFYTEEEFEMHGNHIQRLGYSVIEKLYIP